ncbi:hypothetical protein BP00DRAFT_497555 [Aspergillus indologenus CBS 114.80]|uniref:Uncharacterized protein n=1 Tax=Aspergillus indologenus CBS 114.80 TaxID=1450541 RepID=A0A2V5I1S0_9EURO|nr:hypothetical protein BP00DRAFT_497555 [Aspergillus indologenus CBS 114.80]
MASPPGTDVPSMGATQCSRGALLPGADAMDMEKDKETTPTPNAMDIEKDKGTTPTPKSPNAMELDRDQTATSQTQREQELSSEVEEVDVPDPVIDLTADEEDDPENESIWHSNKFFNNPEAMASVFIDSPSIDRLSEENFASFQKFFNIPKGSQLGRNPRDEIPIPGMKLPARAFQAFNVW